MNNPKLPAITAAELSQRIWQELQRATQDRHHEWRTPVLASIGPSGEPQARTVVLRHADPDARQLTFYTDKRSPKVAELQASASMVLVFWSKRLSWQLRVQSTATVLTEGLKVDAVWDKLKQSPAAGDYLSTSAPGSPLHQHAGTESEDHHLGILVADVVEMDWLELARTGHRRARLVAGEVTWCIP